MSEPMSEHRTFHMIEAVAVSIADQLRQDTSGPLAIDGAAGRSGLEEDLANQGQATAADGLNRTAAR